MFGFLSIFQLIVFAEPGDILEIFIKIVCHSTHSSVKVRTRKVKALQGEASTGLDCSIGAAPPSHLTACYR